MFDVNTPHKFENVYGSNTYVYEEEDCGSDSFCVWQNFYDAETKICDFSLTVFEKNEKNDTYSRTDELQSERCYLKDELTQTLEECGFEVIGFYSDFDFSSTNDTNERWYIVARAKK